jgi:hypothetical protein
MATYVVILALYLGPLAASFFGNTYFPKTRGTQIVNVMTVTSPFMAAFQVPIYMDDLDTSRIKWKRATQGQPSFLTYPLKDLRHFAGYVTFTLLLNGFLFGMMVWMFNSRWRVSASSG